MFLHFVYGFETFLVPKNYFKPSSSDTSAESPKTGSDVRLLKLLGRSQKFHHITFVEFLFAHLCWTDVKIIVVVVVVSSFVCLFVLFSICFEWACQDF